MWENGAKCWVRYETGSEVKTSNAKIAGMAEHRLSNVYVWHKYCIYNVR